jgi:hypothetical protein
MRIVSRDRTILLTLLVAALFLRGRRLCTCTTATTDRNRGRACTSRMRASTTATRPGRWSIATIDAQLESGLLKSAKLGVDLPAISGTAALSPLLLEVVRRTAGLGSPDRTIPVA